MVGVFLRQACAKQESQDAGVHFVDHVLKQLKRLVLVHQQRVFLLVDRALHVLAQIVHVAQVLLPVVVDEIEHHGLL